MAWENVIAGYKIERFKGEDTIPVGSVFIRTLSSPYMWSASGQVWYETIYEYQVPFYKKKNVKRKSNTPQ